MADTLSRFEAQQVESKVFQDHVARLHDDVLFGIGTGRFEEIAPDAFEGAVLGACEDFDYRHDDWPDLGDERVWRDSILDRALTRLGLDFDEVYPRGLGAAA